MLILQFGGVQLAVIAAPPPLEDDVAANLVSVPSVQFVLPVLIDPGEEEHQVKKLP